jgi:hypothetical protein
MQIDMVLLNTILMPTFINDPDIDATYEAFKNKEVPLFVAYY